MDKLTLEAFYVKKKKSFKYIYYKLKSQIMLAKENKRKNNMGRSFEDTLLAMLFLSSNYYIMNNKNIFLKHLNKYYKGIKKVKFPTDNKNNTEVYKILLKRISYRIYNIFLKTMKNKEREDTPDVKYTLYNINKNKNIQEEYLCNISEKYFKPLLSYITINKGSFLIMEFYNISSIFIRQYKFFTNMKENNKHIIYDTFFL
ncbi:conserved Plasmodium protein, unknown function [Plasmodium reichenowi]|uniref:Uncharacterized protein n=1 Tax=Plasmodium reichenowi TaxID=5854 RepID=A0A151LFJ0_PLARE|nr:hypothetical protein PRSY57_1017800 [Plasmodium reichenowi]KYN97637.1 hypothetical protein PRSY57_1017800 [Plasmodium reichenowi]SOV79773.1 conserved Plasmodium protein, unknown function [Plasmodium reichenowi]